MSPVYRAAHTPGPWRLKYSEPSVLSDPYPQSVVGPDGRNVVFACVTGTSASSGGEYVENARLIAAAPDGLSAAERAYAVLAGQCEWPGRNTTEGQALLCDLRDYLCKALDREPQDVQDDYPNRAKPLAKATGAV